MSMRKNILLALLAMAPVAAFADISWYVGAGAGGTKLEEDVDVAIGAFVDDGNGGLTLIAENRLGKFHGTDLGYRIFGGLRFGQYFGLEVGYVDLGSPEDSLDLVVPPQSSSGTEIDASLKLTDDIHGLDAYLVGAWPINDKWEAIAKLGMISWDSTFKVKNAYGETFPNTGTGTLPTILPYTFSVDSDGTDLAGAIGVNYKATENMTLRAEGTWYDIEDTEKAWLLGGFVIYNF